ncbi:MAG: hypothetical protein FWC91_12470 [Defluviitaleaceae bacterium]|nr:hypothetical protein [Defluviitaleaceae bacterium]
MLKIIVCLLVLAGFPSVLYAQNRQITFPRIVPEQRALEYFALTQRNNNLSWEELAEISLWASGDTTLSAMPRIRDAVNALHNSGGLPVSGRERAEFILTFLHGNILRAYSLYQTRVDTVFTNGRFNCVSSSVLYMILSTSAGINTSGVITRDHAFIIAHIDGQDIDVETTNRFGFDPGNRREFHDEFGRVTGFAYVPAQNFRDRQTISQIELISVIFNNRIVQAERQNRFVEAVPLAVDRTAMLLGDLSSANRFESQGSESIFADPRRELLDRLINYGASLLRSNREEDALRWAIAASAVYPAPDRWPEFIMTSVNNRIVRFMRDRRIVDARNFLESHRLFLSPDELIRLDSIVVDAELLHAARGITDVDEGNIIIEAIVLAQTNNRLDDRRAAELITFAVQRTSAIIRAPPNHDWRAAIIFIENAVSRFGTNRDWEQTLQTYRSNLAADYHNRFAAAWNSQNFDEATRILNEGLAEFPNDRQLLSNRAIVNRRQQQN